MGKFNNHNKIKDVSHEHKLTNNAAYHLKKVVTCYHGNYVQNQGRQLPSKIITKLPNMMIQVHNSFPVYCRLI